MLPALVRTLVASSDCVWIPHVDQMHDQHVARFIDIDRDFVRCLPCEDPPERHVLPGTATTWDLDEAGACLAAKAEAHHSPAADDHLPRGVDEHPGEGTHPFDRSDSTRRRPTHLVWP